MSERCPQDTISTRSGRVEWEETAGLRPFIGCIFCFGRLEAGGFVDWCRVKAMNGGDGVG